MIIPSTTLLVLLISAVAPAIAVPTGETSLSTGQQPTPKASLFVRQHGGHGGDDTPGVPDDKGNHPVGTDDKGTHPAGTDDRRGGLLSDDDDGVRVNATLNAAVTLTPNRKEDVTYPDGFEIDVSSSVANAVTVTSGPPSITVLPAGFKQLSKNSWKVVYRTALAATTNSSTKIEFPVTAAAVSAAGGVRASDARLAFLQNGAWTVDEANTRFDDSESKTQYTGPSASASGEWIVLVKTASGTAPSSSNPAVAIGSPNQISAAVAASPHLLGLASLGGLSVAWVLV